MSGLRIVLLAVLLLSLLMLQACSPALEQEAAAEVARPVSVLTMVEEPLLVSSALPGRVEPVRVAEVRARVAGIVVQKHFIEGADVKAGDLLFQIDPAPLAAAVSRAEGELERAKAVLLEASVRAKRYEPLVASGAVSRQDFDSATSDLQVARAATRSAQAELENARLNLGYTTVTAPISGRIGRALVTEGALVGQGDATLMARIQQLDTVYVDFTQSAVEVLRLREAIEKGGLASIEGHALLIRVDGTHYQREGSLLFTDVAVDPSTGQVSMRGEFANADGVLLPGMYVRVQAPRGLNQQALLVPQRAVQRANDGSAHVLVVGTDERVEVRKVKTGVMQDSRWQISEGLRAGDRVIVGGLAGLQPGVLVAAQGAQDQQASRQ